MVSVSRSAEAGRNGATDPGEDGLRYPIGSIDPDVDPDPVAAQRIVVFKGEVVRIELASMARVLVPVDDLFSIEIVHSSWVPVSRERPSDAPSPSSGACHPSSSFTR